MEIKKIKLKGGSLSSTHLIIEGNHKYVLKEISVRKNREYGFQRWYSQLKKLQRFEKLFPNSFPKLLDFGIKDDFAYFKMEYIENSVNGYEYLKDEKNELKIQTFFNKVIEKLNVLHDFKLNYFPNSLELYFNEEVLNRLSDAKKDNEFNKFTKNEIIVFNGKKVEPLCKNLNKYKELFISNNMIDFESFTHGNVTLENIVYNPKKSDVFFIDPYEENIIDHPFTEFSQILQSSNSLYEYYNEQKILIDKNFISTKNEPPKGVTYFNVLFKEFLSNNYSKKERLMINLFEISQFVRMLPFKSPKDFDKKIYFYSLASASLDNLIKNQYYEHN